MRDEIMFGEKKENEKLVRRQNFLLYFNHFLLGSHSMHVCKSHDHEFFDTMKCTFQRLLCAAQYSVHRMWCDFVRPHSMYRSWDVAGNPAQRCSNWTSLHDMRLRSILCVCLFQFRVARHPSARTMVRVPFQRRDFVTSVTCRFDCWTSYASHFDRIQWWCPLMSLSRYASSLH